MLKVLCVGLMWALYVLVILFLSEQVTFFDKTQWCLLAIMYWLISISFDIYTNKE